MQEVLRHLLSESTDITAALVSRAFVEDFLAPVLTSKQNAKVLLKTMRSLGYEKQARPLLLAFEAAMLNNPGKLTELEPEIQEASLRMNRRLRSS